MAELTFEDFQRMAADKSLSPTEKIGFPDSYRKGYTHAILQDIFQKLPIDSTREKQIMDIGCGCDELAVEFLRVSERQAHKTILIDSKEMLDGLPEHPLSIKMPGKFPFEDNCLEQYKGKVDFILCYSVLFYIFAHDNLFQFLHSAIDMLKPGGKLLLGDIPNIDKRSRFIDSEEGKEFLKNAPPLQGSTAHENNAQKMDDSVVLSIVTRARRFGCESYLLPQASSLPLSNRREDILIVRR